MSRKSVLEKLKQKLTKKYTMNKAEIEEIVFYERAKAQHEIEMQTWSQLADQARIRFLHRCGLDPKEWHINWENLLETGQIEAVKLEVVQDKVQTDEQQTTNESS